MAGDRIDYRKILMDYMDHVARLAGTDFVSSGVKGLSHPEKVALLDACVEARGVEGWGGDVFRELEDLKRIKPGAP